MKGFLSLFFGWFLLLGNLFMAVYFRGEWSGLFNAFVAGIMACIVVERIGTT